MYVVCMFVPVPLNKEQIFCMCCIYAHGGEPADKATLMCVCTLALLDHSFFAHVNCVHVYMVIAMNHCNYCSHAYARREKGLATLD